MTYVFNRQFQICLENGYNLQIDYDAKNPTSTLKITGKGSKINNYLRTSEKAGAEIQGEDFEAFYGLDKPDFRKKVGEIKNKTRKLLDSLTGISKELRTREEANIHYNYLIYLDQYPSVSADIRGLAANDLEYEDIARELKELDYLRVGDFQYSQAYVILTDQYFSDRIEDKIQIDGLDRESAFFNGMGEIPMGPIRNSLLYGSARMDLPNSADTNMSI